MAKAPLTLVEVYDLMTAALDQMNGTTCAVPYGETSLRTAERTLQVLRFGILLEIDGVSPQSLIPKKD